MGLFCDDCGALLPPGKTRCPNCGSDGKRSRPRDEVISSGPGLFPFKDVRKGQQEFMDDSKKAVEQGRPLIAHAPTGIGKTAAVLTAALKARNKETVFFLTSKQSQHHIAVETVKRMPTHVSAIDVIAKQSMCPREESRLPYPVFEKFCSEKGQSRCNLFNKTMGKVVDKLKGQTRHVEDLVKVCSNYNVCPHKAALSAGKEADVIICDYNYIFSDIRERIFELLDITLEDTIVIVDEAHNLPDRVRGHLEESINEQILWDAFDLLNGKSSELAAFIKRLHSEIDRTQIEDTEVEKSFLDDMIEMALRGGFGRYEKVEDVIEDLEMHARNLMETDPAATAPMRLYSFLKSWQVEGKEVFRAYENNPSRVKVGLLDPSRITAEAFHNISASILMSGTLHPGEMYADLLGVEDPMIRKYESPFPKENRRIVSVKNLTTAYKERGVKMFQAYANSIADVCNNTPGNVAVFFPSYEIKNRILDRLELVHLKKDILVEQRDHSKGEKRDLVDELKRSDDNLLLGVQGGSLSEGVDYKNNILSSVIIAGIPFPPPSIELKALQEYYTQKFNKDKGYEYVRIYPALNRVLQAAGRPIRSSEDRTLIILMDKRFNYSSYKNRFPSGFDYSQKVSLVKECERFFG